MTIKDAALLEDLARSGLTAKDAGRMRLELLGDSKRGAWARKAVGDRRAYVIPYFGPGGAPADFERVRFLGEPPLDRRGKPLRYLQPGSSAPQVYFPPLVDWAAVAADPTVPVILTEGEKKSYAGCKFLGKKNPVIGLGGVYSFGSKGLHESLLPELQPYFRDGRKVIVCFDREPSPNPDVARACNRLARQARINKAEAWRLELPAMAPGQKVGLDDALVGLGADAVLGLLESGLTPYDDLAKLDELNAELAYIRGSGTVYHLPTRAMYSQAARLVTIIYADRVVTRYDKKGEPVEKNLCAEWLKWPGRRTHQRVAYEPGEPEALEDGGLNVWQGLAVEPARGDVSMFTKLLDQVFADDKEGSARRWCEQWLAYPLQHPGTKMYAGVLMYSEIQGSGKSLIGETMGRIYGENFRSISAEELHSQFNDWAKYAQFVLGDEVTGSDRREDEDRLKNIITQERVTINEKYQAKYSLAAKHNLWLTTNRGNALSIPIHDRRWFVWEILRNIWPLEWYTDRYDAWYKDPASAAAVLWWLLEKVDTSDFNPRAPAPLTSAKRDMQEVSGSGTDYLVREMLSSPEAHFAGDRRDLHTAAEIAAAIDRTGRMNPVSVALALKVCGVPRLEKTKIGGRGATPLYPVRNVDAWTRAGHGARKAHYEHGAAIVPSLPRCLPSDDGRLVYATGVDRLFKGVKGKWVWQREDEK